MKNIGELIHDLEQVRDSKLSPKEMLRKVNELGFVHDSSDGFEDVLDAIRPFLYQLAEFPDYQRRSLLVERLALLIQELKSGSSLESLKKIPLRYEKNRVSRIDVEGLILLTIIGAVLTYLVSLFVKN